MSDETQRTDNPLTRFIAQLQAERTRLADLDWTPPEPPTDAPTYDDFRLKPISMTELAPLPDPLTLDALRARLPIRLHDYLASDSQAALLVRVPPGAGKTHTTVGVAQFFAQQGLRGLWAASRHNMFKDLENFKHFNPSLWYHWLSIQAEVDEEPVCRYGGAQRKWSELGYESMGLCHQLCGKRADNWIKRCPYRRQEQVSKPLIFAQHQHLTSGLAISNFDFVIVDELPLGVFVQDRRIPIQGLDVGATGPLGHLVEQIADICRSMPTGCRVADKGLFDQIGDTLTDVYEQIDLAIGVLPDMPRVSSEHEVSRQPYWYLFDLLRLAAVEHQAWSKGWKTWNASMWCTSSGLHLLSRSTLWEKLPPKIIVLDATAQADLYRIIFQRDIELYAPAVERQGKLYQVAGRLNGKSATVRRDVLTDSGREMLDVAKRLTAEAKQPGIICWKAIAPHFRREFGADRVLTFGALRGTNALEDADVLIVAGTPTPDGSAMLDLAVALSSRIDPFFKYDDDGKRLPIYRHADREYRLSAAGIECVRAQYGEQFKSVTRRTGIYPDPTLDAIHRQLRESELIQAIHRARINIRAATVWLLTSTPLQEELLDGVWNDPPLGPQGIHWQVWLRLEPWLRQQWQTSNPIDNHSLATAAGVSLNWVQRNGWLDLIAEYMPGQWQISRLNPSGRGRPKSGAIPLRPSTTNSGIN